MRAPPDEFDRRILALVQKDNQQSHQKIAEQVHLSAAAVARRLQRVRKDGVIRRDASSLDPRAVGRPLSIVVEVSLASELPERLNAAMERFRVREEVQRCYYVAGRCDIILILNLRDMDEYEALTRTLFLEPGDVSAFQTMVVMRTVKDEDQVITE